MDTTVTLEFLSESPEHLKQLEHVLKQVHNTQVYLVEPRDAGAPVLVSIGIGGKRDEQSALAIRRTAHVLYDFLHSSDSVASEKKLTLVTIEGESKDIAPLTYDEIEQVLAGAYEGQFS